MVLATLLGRGARRTELAAIEIDATITESTRRSAQVTEHAIERGGMVADHRRRQSLELVLDGVLSDAPTSLLGAIAGELGDDTQEGAHDRWLALLEVEASGEPFELVTAAARHENMVFLELSQTRDAQIGSAIRFSATLRQLQFATSRRVAVEVPPERVADGGQPTQDRGRRPTETVATPQPVTSTLRRLTDLTGLTGG